MAEKFNNKYRIPSARLQTWDYGSSGLYFITICTKNREHYFGVISNSEMNLSKIGKIVESEWIKTFEMRPDMNLGMGEYIIMPNHFHAVISIGENRYNNVKNENDADAVAVCSEMDAHRRDAMPCVSTCTESETYKTNQFGPQSNNLASVIRGFKIGVTTNARKINPDFAWQSRYHDHIIRNNRSLENIQRYIINNPSQWKADTFHNDNQRK